MLTRRHWLSSLSLLLSACSSIKLPDAKICAVSGVMAAGADCAYMNSGKVEELNLDQFVTFLEPQVEPPRGAAMCMSSEDFSKLKTAIEQACAKLGTSCTKETQEGIRRVSALVDTLQAKVIFKKANLPTATVQ